MEDEDLMGIIIKEPKEWNLSDKREKWQSVYKYSEEDVKEFIRLLKEETRKIDNAKTGRNDNYVISIGRMIKIIDKLIGEKFK
jgi:hypothetical protein